jgi:hypothetical protein
VALARHGLVVLVVYGVAVFRSTEFEHACSDAWRRCAASRD